MAQTVSGTFTLTVKAAPGLTITSTSPLSEGTVGVAYHFQFSATGGIAPYKWAANSLPAGLSLSSDGVLSGVPTAPTVDANIVITVSDSGV